jgi:hypothetical protein
MTAFIAQVRLVLNQTASPGQHRWLCVRIPSDTIKHDRLGIDLKAWIEAGVDIVNVSTFNYCSQDTDLSEIIAQIPNTPVFLEMTHATMHGEKLTDSDYDVYPYRRTTNEQFYTTAHLAYSKGAAGISVFNFPYYRSHGLPAMGPFNEPPFEIFQHLGNPDWLSKQSQHYFLANAWTKPLPKLFNPGQTAVLEMNIDLPTESRTMQGKFRIQSTGSMPESHFSVEINGVGLLETEDISEPFNSPYIPFLATEDTTTAWQVDTNILNDGSNTITITITMIDGIPQKINYADLAVFVKPTTKDGSGKANCTDGM